MKFSERVQEWLAERVTFVQYPRIRPIPQQNRVQQPPQGPAITDPFARLLVGVVSLVIGVIGIAGIVVGAGLTLWLVWAILFN